MKRTRRGFSLPEVLVAVVLLGVIGGALTKLVVSQMRFFDNVSTTRNARTVARNSMNVLLSDLRMVQDSGGVTAIAANGSSISVNVPYSVGVFCGTSGGVSTVSMVPTDSSVLAFAVYAGYGLRNRVSGRWVTTASAGVQPVTSLTPTRCTGTGAGQASINTVTVSGRAGLVLDIVPTIDLTTTLGSAVMFYQNITYSFAASSLFPGKFGLWRTVTGGVTEELMAPFAASARFRYYVAGDDTSKTTVPALSDIRGVDLVLTAVSARTPAGQTAPSQSKMVTSVFFKNVRAP